MKGCFEIRGHLLPILATTPILVIGALLAVPDDAWSRDAAGRVITLWNGGCSGSTRGWWDNMVRAWYDEVSNTAPIWGHGPYAYGRKGLKVNGSIVDSDFADASAVWWGNDHGSGRPDAVDAFMVGLHGLEASNDAWVGRVRVNEAGSGNCNAWQGHMEFGDLDLEFLHLSSCFSMDREDWWPEWSRSFESRAPDRRVPRAHVDRFGARGRLRGLRQRRVLGEHGERLDRQHVRLQHQRIVRSVSGRAERRRVVGRRDPAHELRAIQLGLARSARPRSEPAPPGALRGRL